MRFGWICLVLVLGCDGPPSGTDAGEDAGVDAGVDAGADAGPMCTPECGMGDACCVDPAGLPACFVVRSDVTHCGTCEVNCASSHRGDGCEAFHCTCGTDTLGCAGSRESYCCPPRAVGSEPYCANLDTDESDCGGCNIGCDRTQADRCDGGRCICGRERDACEGTDTSRCCADSPADIHCVDTTTDAFHCGSCGNLCGAAERCENGSCTVGGACTARCSATETCCDGTCCPSARCIGQVCT